MLPSQGSMISKLDDKQVLSLLSAFAKRSDKPAGSFFSYLDSANGMADPTTVRDSIRISGVDYKTDELWRVSEGVTVTGDTLDAEQFGNHVWRDAIFHMDPATGECTFLGTEPGTGPTLPF
jgi:hypothetical protein